MRGRQQRNQARFPGTRKHYQRAGIGERVVGAGDADIDGGAALAEFLAVRDAGADAGKIRDAAFGEERRIRGQSRLACDGGGDERARICGRGGVIGLAGQRFDAGEHARDTRRRIVGGNADASGRRRAWGLAGAASNGGADAVQYVLARH
jgi:hypothetical protein